MGIVGTRNGEKARLNSAVSDLKGCPIVEVVVWAEHGQEHYHPDVGEYWKPAHIVVSGDMNDMATLRVLNKVMDDHGLKVHTKNGVNFSGDDYARLVLTH